MMSGLRKMVSEDFEVSLRITKTGIVDHHLPVSIEPPEILGGSSIDPNRIYDVFLPPQLPIRAVFSADDGRRERCSIRSILGRKFCFGQERLARDSPSR